DVLRRDRIEQLGPRREAQPIYFDQQPPRDAQTFAHIATVIHVRVVDEAFPSHGRARLFEVHAHDYEESIRGVALQLRQPPRIVERRIGVVDGTRADDT